MSPHIDTSSFQSVSQYSPEIDGKKSRISHDEGISAPSSDHSSTDARSDNESCELNMTTDESDDDREIITKESIVAKIKVGSSQISTDEIVTSSPEDPTPDRSLSLMNPSSLV
ncbi:hypothetical protein PFISCL1PPCAC_28349 [Pristionchus fissidentatus]|uniref:Uncharacterized protein n=1 Tax=Pristionchus fissidentatus TaxID=1538716 RepID=A0AAV5X110_9BILA|nr:hypothetical protein PFISCL1PPCAC_27892 [Pristionchus fissidentatus]GMT37052.1 hypothetical protein PFISCL1PPCAC_28349 [Pristionchus fissidentatus]